MVAAIEDIDSVAFLEISVYMAQLKTASDMSISPKPIDPLMSRIALARSPRVITINAPIKAMPIPTQRFDPSRSLKTRLAINAVTMGVRLTNKAVRPAGIRANAPKKQML
ncbi:hypothetical protein X896_6263 [Burkholderia pseudomallei ABCPW 1]|nr:hypothetical protein X980_5998 [Burkholderia pseudomallei MSHR4000]KGW80536.1 hypothetical protein Y048_5989 [Burkholderia pseudomallei MSHR456]KGX23790.1 hypothetical protein X896_6263 [Burkholderia pseudomallei ABCPW 1]